MFFLKITSCLFIFTITTVEASEIDEILAEKKSSGIETFSALSTKEEPCDFSTEITGAFSSPIYQGQDDAIPAIGLQIFLNEDNNLIYESLCWHYRMGFRFFDVLYNNISDQSRQKIKLFYSRVEDVCTLSLRKNSIEDSFIFPVYIQRIFNITDRQFLCFNKNINFLLNLSVADTVLLPIFSYCGIDATKDIQQTPINELIPYREKGKAVDFFMLSKIKSVTEIISTRVINIPLETVLAIDSPVLLYEGSKICRKLCYSTGEITTSDEIIDCGSLFICEDAFIADICQKNQAVTNVDNLLYQPLPIKEVIISSIIHACHHTISERKESIIHENEYIKSFISLNPSYSSLLDFDKLNFGFSYMYAIVPKSACSTIFKILDSIETQRNDLEEIYYGLLHKNGYQAEKLIDRSIFKFTVVRNPFVRILSAYLDKIVGRDSYREFFLQGLGFTIHEIVSFKDFLKRIFEKVDKENVSILNEHFRPMWALTLSEIIPYDFIGKLENFPNDLEIILDKLGINEPAAKFFFAPHATCSNKKIPLYFDQESINLVLEIYKKDFEIYGYEKSLSDLI